MIEPCKLPNAQFCTHTFCRLCLKFWFKASPIVSEKIYHKTYCPKCRDVGWIYSYMKDTDQLIPAARMDLNATLNQRDEMGLHLDHDYLHFRAWEPEDESMMTMVFEVGTRELKRYAEDPFSQWQGFIRLDSPCDYKYEFDKFVKSLEIASDQGDNIPNYKISTTTLDWRLIGILGDRKPDEMTLPPVIRESHQEQIFSKLPLVVYFYERTKIKPFSIPFE